MKQTDVDRDYAEYSAGRRAGRDGGYCLQPGSVISATVLQVLGNDQVQISIAGQSIDVLSQVPLQAGQTLQLAGFTDRRTVSGSRW